MNPNTQFDQDTIQKMQIAKAKGFDDNAILQKATQYQAAKTPQATEKPKKSNLLLDLLPLIGGIGGSFIPGLGTIAGGAVGAGLGTLLKQGIQDPQGDFNFGEAGKEAALAGAGGVVGKGVGFIGSKLFPGLAKFGAKAGEDLALKALRPNPGQMTTFAKETGEDLGKFLTKRGLTSLDEVTKHADTLQGSFDNIVMNKNLQIEPSTILDGFTQEIKRLSKSIIPADQAKAETLGQIAKNFMGEYGNGPMSADALTALRREIDQSIKDFSLDQAVKGPLNLTRDVLQNTLRDAADKAGLDVGGKSLKDAGVELSKLYKVMEIGQRQANLGRGSLPTKLTTLLAGGIGGATGGIPGAATAMGAASAINNPNNISLLSKFATGAGNLAGKVPSLPQAGADALTRVGVVTGALPFDTSNAQEGQIVSDIPQPSGMGGQAPDALTASNGSASQGGDTQDAALRQVLATLMFKNAKSIGDLKTAYEFLNPKSTEKPLSAGQQTLKANAQSGLRSLATVESILKRDPNAPIKSKLPIIAGRSAYGTAAKEIADVITRLRTGAALNEQEQHFYESQLPQVFDSPETVKYKINLFRDLFNQFANGQVPEAQNAIPQAQTN